MNGPQGCLYVYGGYDGHSVLADMYKLDLATRTWSLIWASKFSYGCGGSPVGVGGLRPVDFRIHPCRPAAVIGKSKRLGNLGSRNQGRPNFPTGAGAHLWALGVYALLISEFTPVDQQQS